MAPIRLLIADDHRLFREGVKALLATAGDIDIVGEAKTARRLWRTASGWLRTSS